MSFYFVNDRTKPPSCPPKSEDTSLILTDTSGEGEEESEEEELALSQQTPGERRAETRSRSETRGRRPEPVLLHLLLKKDQKAADGALPHLQPARRTDGGRAPSADGNRAGQNLQGDGTDQRPDHRAQGPERGRAKNQQTQKTWKETKRAIRQQRRGGVGQEVNKNRREMR